MADSLALVWDLIARDNASATFRKVGAEAEGASGAVGKLLGGFTALAVGGAIAVATKAAADFQAKMLLIQTQAGATSDEVRKMSPAILTLAGQVAQAPEALATSLYHVESTGLRGAQALEAVRIAAEGAKVGHADLEETTNALTATIASGMLPATETYSQAMGQLNTIVGSGDMKMQDLNDALGTGLLVTMKQYGVTIPDVGAALADFGDNNIRGADAATKLRMAVQAIESPARGGQAALEKIGITSSQLAQDMATGGLNKALTDLHDHLVNSGIDASQWGQILTDAFTKKAGSGVLTLIGTFDRFQQKYKEVSDGANSFGDAWAATTKTASFQFSALGNSMEALGIKIGTAVLPYVTSLAQHINDFVNSQGFQDFLSRVGDAALTAGHAIGGLVQGFMDLPTPIKDVAYALALLKLADYVGVTEKLSAGIGSMRTAFAGFREESALQQSLWAMNQRSAIETGRAYGDMEHALGGFGLTAEAAGAGATGLEGKLGTLAVRGMTGLKAAGSGVMNMLGGPWGAALLGATAVVGVLEASIQHGEDTTRAWTEALKQGGDAAEKARLQMDQTDQTLDKLNSGATGFGTKLLGLNSIINSSAGSSKDAKKAYDDWYNALGLVDQKSQDVQLATAHLNDVMKTNAAGSLAVREAAQGVRDAQEAQRQAQEDLNQVTKTAAQLAYDNANAVIAEARAGENSKAAFDDFTTTLGQYRTDTKDATVSAAQLTAEQHRVADSAFNAADGAGRAAEAYGKASGMSDTSAASAYGQLIMLEKVAQALGTDTPASVRTSIAALQQSVAQGKLTADQMDAIARAVDGIPDNQKINVTSDTSQAVSDINGMISQYRHIQYTGSAILVNGRVVANAEGNLLQAFAAGGMSPMSSSVAQVVQPGTLRVIGDNPVADEAFIPINNSSRSMQILGETASRMGMGLVAMANGGMATWGQPWGTGDRFPVGADAGLLSSFRSVLDHDAFQLGTAKAAASFSGGSPAGGNAAMRALGQQIAANLGWASQFAAIDYIFSHESGWNPNAQNPTSTAYGIPQFLNSTWASYGGKTSSPGLQITDGIRYMVDRYHSPNGAAAFWQAHHWYDKGTNYVPSDQLAVLHRGEAVVPASKNQGAPFVGGNGPVQITGRLEIGGDGMATLIGEVLDMATDRGAYNG